MVLRVDLDIAISIYVARSSNPYVTKTALLIQIFGHAVIHSGRIIG